MTEDMKWSHWGPLSVPGAGTLHNLDQTGVRWTDGNAQNLYYPTVFFGNSVFTVEAQHVSTLTMTLQTAAAQILTCVVG